MATAAKTPVPGNAVPARAQVEDDKRKYARTVKALARGHYGQIREEGDVFENSLDLPTTDDDENSWLEAVKD